MGSVQTVCKVCSYLIFKMAVFHRVAFVEFGQILCSLVKFQNDSQSL